MNDLQQIKQNTKMYFGIDTLYYFCETNENYDDLFLEIIDQMEDIKGGFERREIQYKPSDINITLNEMNFEFLGKNEGFYWFRDHNEYFKIGFKDYLTNRGLHNIRVQLQGEGIYTLGMSSLLELINKSLLDDYIRENKPITRIDLNCFLQYDLSFATKEMFVSRKRSYSQISEISTAKRTQTIYVGKPPFRLRLYDKREEMKKSKKGDLMHEFLLNQGFDLDEELFNVEFEMHRRHLKAYGIETIEDALKNAESLFKSAMDEIRLIDINTITKKDIENNSKSRAITLPIWDDIKNAYSIEAFMQNTLPVQRIKRKLILYSDEKFKDEFTSMIRKAFMHSLPITHKLLESYLEETVEALTMPKKQVMKKGYVEVEVEGVDGNKEQFRLLDDGTLIKPVTTTSVTRMDNYELLCYLDDVSKGFDKQDSANYLKRYEIAYEEAVRRGLVLDIPF
ncbi:MAG: hypothetical protein M0R46_16350 [Candidatus Muirbacterium halophilum]|nr:hypothetical protein [Candidatus Muirbacterium halophilum]